MTPKPKQVTEKRWALLTSDLTDILFLAERRQTRESFKCEWFVSKAVPPCRFVRVTLTYRVPR